MDFLSEVYGQEPVREALWRLWRGGRLPHTMIFYGDEGLGKTTAALSLASAVTGEAVYEEAAPRLAEISPADLPVLTAGKETVWYLRPPRAELKIEQFRLFLDAMASFDGRPHVCIIDEAQTMRREIANAMLKTLEEPEAEVTFILVTHELSALLPTIISRAERFRFLPLSREAYGALVRARSGDFHLKTEEEIENAFLLSEGNPGLTLSMFAETGPAQPETAMALWEILTESGTPFSDGFRKPFFGEGTAEEQRRNLRAMLRWMMLIGRDLLVTAAAPEADFLHCRHEAARIRRLAPLWGASGAEAALEVLKEADAAARRYISAKNIWDMVLLSLARIRKGK